MRVAFVFLIGLALFICPTQGRAENSIAVVNVDRVMTVSKAAKDLEKQMKGKQEQYQKEFSTHERNLREAQAKLVEEKASLSEEEFGKKVKEFEKKLLETKALFQKRRSALTKAFGKASGQIQKTMFEAVADISTERGYKIILDRRSLVIVEENLDITAAVIEAVDKKLPSIKLDISE